MFARDKLNIRANAKEGIFSGAYGTSIFFLLSHFWCSIEM